MTDIRVKFQRSANGMAYYRNEIHLTEENKLLVAGRNPYWKKTAENI